MKLNPLIAKQPEDLEKLEFKKMKSIIKKELKRLQKYTSKEKPTQCILIGAHPYQDKPDMALPLFGKWKGKFKAFAKKKVVKDPLGAIGTAYFEGIDEQSGQKVVRILLAKGKGKKKVNKIQRTLKKLIPQASYNVIFSEISEEELLLIEQELDQVPEIQEEEIPEVEKQLPSTLLHKLLISNFKEIKTCYQQLAQQVNDKKEALLPDAENLSDLCEEWFELYRSGNESSQNIFTKQAEQIRLLQAQLSKLLEQIQQNAQKLEKSNAGAAKVSPPDLSFIDNLMADGEKPADIFDIGLSEEMMEGIFVKQQADSSNCDAAARLSVYRYFEKKGLAKIDHKKMESKNAFEPYLYNKNMQTLTLSVSELNSCVESEYEIDFVLNQSKSGKNSLSIMQETASGNRAGKDIRKALTYIDANLSNGIPVIAGVSTVDKKGKGGNDGTTDHFIVLVGKSSKGYHFVDPAIQLGTENHIQFNVLSPSPNNDFSFIDADLKWGPNSVPYILSTVSVYPQHRPHLDKIPSITRYEIKASVGSTGQNDPYDVMVVQTLLKKAGYDLGSAGIDGDCGGKTKEAIRQFIQSHQLQEHGLLVQMDNPIWKALLGDHVLSNELDPQAVQLEFRGGAQQLSSKAEQVIREILAKAGEPQAVIISTLRSAEQQAQVMFNNIKNFGPEVNRNQYKDKAAAGKVVDAYEAAKAAGKGDTEIVGAILAAIKAVGADKLSDHCNSSNPAIDIHPASIKNKATFEQILKADGRVTVICPPKDTSYHILVK